MTQVIKIDDATQMAKLKYDNCCFPFISIGTIDTIIELNRPDLEELYPTHTVILFNQKRKVGIAYIAISIYLAHFNTIYY